jgi:molybdopterin converting factor small subunit
LKTFGARRNILGEIRVRLYGALNLIDEVKKDKDRFKDRLKNGFLLSINEPANVGDVLKMLKIPIKDVNIVSIGKERVMLDAKLKDGDILHIFPLMGGG